MSKKNEPINVRVTRLQQSRYEREQRQRRIVLIGALVVGVLTVVLVVAALLQIFVIDPQRTVATVNGQSVALNTLQKRMRYDQGQLVNQFNRLAQQASQAQSSQDPSAQFLIQFYQQQMQQLATQGDSASIARNSYDNLVGDLLIRQEAARRGIKVDPSEVQKQLETSYGLYRETLTPFPTNTPAPPNTPAPTVQITATRAATEPTVTPTVILPTDTPRVQPTSIREDEYNLLFQRTVDGYKAIGMTEADIRTIIEDNLYTEKLQKAFADETPKTALQYKFDYIRFNTDTDAQKALTRLTNKEIAFPALISETNAITTPTSIGNGSSVDWMTKQNVLDQYGQQVEQALAVKSIGAPAGVITATDGGFYVLLPLGREDRALTDSDLQSEQQRVYSNWLNTARNDPTKVVEVTDPLTVIPADVKSAADTFIAQFGSSGSIPQQ